MHNGFDGKAITQLRSKKNKLNPFIPYHFLHEEEPGLSGGIETVNTIFLTSKECVRACGCNGGGAVFIHRAFCQ